MTIMRMMQQGALTIARWGLKYSSAHAAAGFPEAHWNLLVQSEPWSPAERRQVRTILAEAINLTLEIAGMPSEPLPGQYAAAVIAVLVAPCNRIVAAHRAPNTYDAISASGLLGEVEVKEMTATQMVSLVMVYSSGHFPEADYNWDPQIADRVIDDAAKA